MDPLELQTLQRYNRFAGKFGMGYQGVGQTGFGYRRRSMLYRYVFSKMISGELPECPITMLDCGCGNGMWIPLITSCINIAAIDGIDFSERLAALAVERGFYRKVVCGNVLEIQSLFHEKYHLVVSSEVYHYIPEEKRNLFWDVHSEKLQNDGCMVFCGPNLQSILRMVRPLKRGSQYSINDVITRIALHADLRILSMAGAGIFTGRIIKIPLRNLGWLNRLMLFNICIILSKKGSRTVRTNLNQCFAL